MSQPAAQEVSAAIEEFRKAGVPIEQARRPFFSKKMTGFNASVYANWIERWASNAAVNYPIVKGSSGVGFLRECAKDVPAVVIGIGPSLDDEIKALAQIDKFAVVIATDAALRPLLRYGIKPDLVLNYDARDEQRTMWETIERDTKDIVLLANSCTSPLTIAAWKGQVMFFNMIQSDDEFATNILPAMFPFLDGLPNCGTVGNGAVMLARLMGCKPILTVGMDLCYRRANEIVNQPGILIDRDEVSVPIWKYRAKDWAFRTARDVPDGQWIEIENKVLYDNAERMAETFDEEIKGKTYRVDEPLKFYRNSLISNIGQADIKLVNCSGGVLTDLVESMPLAEAREKYLASSLAPGRTIAKFLKALVPAANRDWRLAEEARLFLPIAPSIGSWK